MTEPVTEDGGAPAVGQAVFDTVRNRFGQVTGHEGPCLQLCPLAGGRQWDADPAQVRVLGRRELLRVLVAEANARSWQRF
ncbi:hypothetical protein [Streptomyces iconiensis]|uniref:Uncharacterized protein n=1 Tax=Streptomyces iconiensis TaxID=1384038 RepID=A0ABT6ZP16_9ACTN|nr:hypothetical protein [Streptomyces iconiensis]MDJ1130793.1 hypothetical protein [Streptomyces iconiensis]